MNKTSVEYLLKRNPKIRKAVKNMCQSLGQIKDLQSVSFSSANKEIFSISKEEINKVNKGVK